MRKLVEPFMAAWFERRRMRTTYGRSDAKLDDASALQRRRVQAIGVNATLE